MPGSLGHSPQFSVPFPSRVLSEYSQHVNFHLELKGQAMNPDPQECLEQSAPGPCSSLLWVSGLQSIVFNSSPPPQSIFKVNLMKHFNTLIFENGLFWRKWNRSQKSQCFGLFLNRPPQGSSGDLLRTLKSFLHTPPQRHFSLGTTLAIQWLRHFSLGNKSQC